MLIKPFDVANIELKIVRFEESYHIKFPQQYREFLVKYNGGITPQTSFRVKPRKIENVSGFYGLGVADDWDLMAHPCLEDFLCEGYLPIAEDDFGNDYLIGVGRENHGKIYFYDQEEQKAELVRENLKTFVLSCESKKPKKVRSIAEREASMAAKGRSQFVDDELRAAWQAEIDYYGGEREAVVID